MRSTLAPNFIASLLSWYDSVKRDLPWRDHPYPYAVLVSEIMLQQTTVPAVLPYFRKWMKAYPTVAHLARADLDDVLLLWEGLGYYSRARNLHAAAREIAGRFNCRVPSDPEELKELKGIGDYTAAAIASIAYGVRSPALDANNMRVWSRLLATSDRRRITGVFTRVLPEDRPGDVNQALMDLGSALCTPRDPDCPACPLAAWCRALRSGEVSRFPEKKTRPGTERIEAAIGLILKDGKILVQRRADTGLMAGLWEFPGGKIGKAVRHGDTETRRRGEKTRYETPEEAVVREVREETGFRVEVCGKLGVFTHAYTRFRVKLHVFICKRKAGTLHNLSARWVTLEELEGLAMPSVNRRIVRKLEERLNA